MSDSNSPSQPRKVSLKIVSPCEANWDAMPGDDKTRYCVECRLSVHDFTQCTDEEIAAVARRSQTRVCGRLRSPTSSVDGATRKRRNRFQFSIAWLLVLATMSASLFASLPWIGRKIEPLVHRWLSPPQEPPIASGAGLMMGEVEMGVVMEIPPDGNGEFDRTCDEL